MQCPCCNEYIDRWLLNQRLTKGTVLSPLLAIPTDVWISISTFFPLHEVGKYLARGLHPHVTFNIPTYLRLRIHEGIAPGIRWKTALSWCFHSKEDIFSYNKGKPIEFEEESLFDRTLNSYWVETRLMNPLTYKEECMLMSWIVKFQYFHIHGAKVSFGGGDQQHAIGNSLPGVKHQLSETSVRNGCHPSKDDCMPTSPHVPGIETVHGKVHQIVYPEAS